MALHIERNMGPPAGNQISHPRIKCQTSDVTNLTSIRSAAPANRVYAADGGLWRTVAVGIVPDLAKDSFSRIGRCAARELPMDVLRGVKRAAPARFVVQLGARICDQPFGRGAMLDALGH